ncbi:MAG: HD domain-containing phosphohydrolase [Candidatus Omnitrophota bacterium]
MRNKYQEELFNKIFELSEWKKTQQLITTYLGKEGRWWFIPKISRKTLYLLKNTVCVRQRIASCITRWLRYLQTAKRKHTPVIFTCNNRYVYCFPLCRGDKLYGYVGTCNVRAKISDNLLEFFDLLIKTIIENAQKELELSKLYETIRPRAIALSTIHTVNRIISANLDLDNLLPRIARLTLQVIKAQRCSIMLLDSDKDQLRPMAVIDLKQKIVDLNKKVFLKKGLPAKVVRTGRAIFKNQYISIPMVSDEKIIGVITVSNNINKKSFNLFDFEILSTLTEQAVIAIKNAKLHTKQKEITYGSIKALASVLDIGMNDRSTSPAIFINVTIAIARELRMPESEMKILYFASMLHHAGKTSIPEKIIKKRSPLTGKELNIIKKHPIVGAQIIQPLDDLEPVIPIILHHHERYDGTGYPQGLKQNEIPFGARIMSIADSFEAMISKRPYRKPMTVKQAMLEITRHSGTQFDPQVVDAFCHVIKRTNYKKILYNEKYFQNFL